MAACGVNPSNQTARFSVVVPVLPAAGRPSSRAPVAVPSRTTRVIASTASAATSALIASLTCGVTAQAGTESSTEVTALTR